MKISKEVKIGISSLAILAITYWGINFLKGQNLFSGNNIYYAIYQNIDGLEMSSPVYIKGLKVGTVLNVGMNDVNGEIKVSFSVKSKYELPENSVAVLGLPSLLSSKAIIITPGNSKAVLKDGETMKSGVNDGMVSMVNEISGKAVTLIDTLALTLNKINALMSEQMIGDVHSTMSNLKDMSYNANDLIVSERKKIAQLTANLNDFSAELKKTMPELQGSVANIKHLTDTLNQSLPELIAEIEKTIAAINSEKGSVGKLLHDDSLYNNLNLTMEEAAALLADLKANPKRYVQFSLFGRKDKTAKENKK